ncbi:hypothetical protein MUO71_07590 [Candidatus Bathyarchaeota archaeon]|nr:hypothetical protein [Candidatus Bathyarchaeota archaeon]
MELNYFLYLVMPLGVLVFFLVGLVIYNARKAEEDDYEKEVKRLRRQLLSRKLDKQTFMRMKTRIKHEKFFNIESKKLLKLLSDQKIDEESYVRLRQVLETSFKNRIDKLDEDTPEPSNNRSFNPSAF